MASTHTHLPTCLGAGEGVLGHWLLVLQGEARAVRLRASPVDVRQPWADCWLCHLLAFGQNTSDLSEPQFPRLGNEHENICFIILLGGLSGEAESG